MIPQFYDLTPQAKTLRFSFLSSTRLSRLGLLNPLLKPSGARRRNTGAKRPGTDPGVLRRHRDVPSENPLRQAGSEGTPQRCSLRGAELGGSVSLGTFLSRQESASASGPRTRFKSPSPSGDSFGAVPSTAPPASPRSPSQTGSAGATGRRGAAPRTVARAPSSSPGRASPAGRRDRAYPATA
jgi:hypothetical protein